MPAIRSSFLAVVFGLSSIALGGLSLYLLLNWPDPPLKTGGSGGSEGLKPGVYVSGEELGRWRPFRDAQAVAADAAQEEKIRQLEKIGYLGGNVEAGGSTGITVSDDRAWSGLNFYTSGHGPEAVLMDMDGNELHRWRCEFDDLVPHFPEAEPDSKNLSRPDEDREFWRRAALYPDGHILAIFEGSALLKLNKDSKIIWALPNRAHHDLTVQEDGSIYVLTRTAMIDPQINESAPVLKDFVVHLSPEGEKLAEYSLWEAVKNSAHSMLLVDAHREGDVFHTNTLEVLDGRHVDRSPFFKKGNILLSFLELNAIAILDPEVDEIVWSMKGMWWGQHQPTLIENGNMLIFDNWGGKTGNQKYSRVIEFDPLTQEIEWIYAGSPDVPFYSLTCGSNQRLRNGNTLITETDNGRVFELTPDNRIVWEFINPARAGEEGNLIASVFELIRYDREYVNFLDAGTP